MPQSPPIPSHSKARKKPSLRRLMGVLHLWLGLGLSLYLVLVCVTGTLLVYEGPIARALNPQIFDVPTGQTRASLDAVRAAFVREFPDATLAEKNSFRTFGDWNGIHRFFLESKAQYVYVDPFTTQIRGVESSQNTFLGQTNALHVSLTLGFVGYLLNGIGGFLAVLLLVSGLWLWWPATKVRLQNLGKLLPSRLWVRRGVPFKKALLDWHNVVGFWSLGLLAIVCLTGSLLIFGAQVRMGLEAASGENLEPVPPKVSPASVGKTLPLDELVRRASAATGGANELYHFQLPLEKQEPAAVTLYYPAGIGVNEWATVWLHPSSGQVLGAYDSPRESRLSRAIGPWMWGLHVGNWGGETVKLLYAILGIVPVWLCVSGVWLWLRKVKKRRQRNSGEG